MKSNFLVYILILLSFWAMAAFGFVAGRLGGNIGFIIFAVLFVLYALTAVGLIGPKKLKTRMREFQVWLRTRAVIFFPLHPYRAIDESLKGGAKEFLPTKERIKNFLILTIITLIFVVLLIGSIILIFY